MPTSFYLLTRFAAPDETVTIIDQTPGGQLVVRNTEGKEWLVQRSELSAAPADQLYRALQHRQPAPMRVPVTTVRFAASV